MAPSKVGIFGGTFDPFHLGHLNSMLSVAEYFKLDHVCAVLACQSPLRTPTEGSSVEQRLEMLRLGIKGHETIIKVDTQEIDRGGVSYTIDTLENYAKNSHETQLFLIIGLDQFLKFDQWKDFDRILELANLIVTSRPGMDPALDLEDWPVGLRPLVADGDRHDAVLKSGKTIHFFQLADVEASGTEIRRKIRLGQNVQSLLPSAVVDYIREQGLYKSVQKKIGDFEKFTRFCEGILVDKGGVSVKFYDLRDRPAACDFALIASGTSTRHAIALSDHLVREVKKEYGAWPESIEGQSEGRWVLVDYGALIVHVFYDFVRQEYRIEDLWAKREN